MTGAPQSRMQSATHGSREHEINPCVYESHLGSNASNNAASSQAHKDPVGGQGVTIAEQDVTPGLVPVSVAETAAGYDAQMMSKTLGSPVPMHAVF